MHLSQSMLSARPSSPALAGTAESSVEPIVHAKRPFPLHYGSRKPTDWDRYNY